MIRQNGSLQNGKRSLPTPHLRGLISKIHKKLKTPYSKIPNNLINKWGTIQKQTSQQKKSQMVERHLRNCSMLLVMRKMQRETTPRYNLAPVTMNKINSIGDSV